MIRVNPRMGMTGGNALQAGQMADHNPGNRLTEKREAFIAAFIGDAKGNATEAARIAGYAQPGQRGHELVKNREIAARISNHVAEKFASADMVLAKLTEIALAPSFEFIEVISRDKSGKPIKVKMDLSDQVKALELLGKYHQIFVDRQVVDMNVREHQRAVPQSTLDAMFRPADRPDA